MAEDRGLGKCEQNHVGSYGYPSRPEEPYGFCAQCGHAMVWQCAQCEAPLPNDSDELLSARFCRECGTPYFPEASDPAAPARTEADR